MIRTFQKPIISKDIEVRWFNIKGEFGFVKKTAEDINQITAREERVIEIGLKKMLPIMESSFRYNKVLASFHSQYVPLQCRNKFYGILQLLYPQLMFDYRSNLKNFDLLDTSNVNYYKECGVNLVLHGSLRHYSGRQVLIWNRDEYNFDLMVYNVAKDKIEYKKTFTQVFSKADIYFLILCWILFFFGITFKAFNMHKEPIICFGLLGGFIYSLIIANSGLLGLLVPLIAIIFAVIPFVISLFIKNISKIRLFINLDVFITFFMAMIIIKKWAVCLFALIVILVGFKFLVRILRKMPYVKSMVKSLLNIEFFYLKNPIALESTLLNEGVRRKELSLYIKWIAASATIAIFISLLKTLTVPILQNCLETKYSLILWISQVIESAGKILFSELCVIIFVAVFCIRPVLVSELQVLSEKEKYVRLSKLQEIMQGADLFPLGNIIQALAWVSIFISFFLPIVNLQGLLAYFSSQGWEGCTPGMLTGIDIIASKGLPSSLYKPIYFYPFLLIPIAAAFGFVECLRFMQKPPPLILYGALMFFYYSAALIAVPILLFFPVRIGWPPILGKGVIFFYAGIILSHFGWLDFETIPRRKRWISGGIGSGCVFVLLGLIAFTLGKVSRRLVSKAKIDKVSFYDAFNAIGKSIDVIMLHSQKPSTKLAQPRDMIFIPEGPFIMGDIGNPFHEGDENTNPGRWIFLNGFYIDEHEVTNKEYSKFLEYVTIYGDSSYCHPEQPKGKDHTPTWWKDPGYYPAEWGFRDGETDDYPVIGVDWFDAYAYAKWAGKRLPTEAEWEKAARGINGRIYPWGNSFVKDTLVNSGPFTEEEKKEFDLYQYVSPVRAFPKGRSFWGCYDLLGNVANWCADYYADNFYEIMPSRNPYCIIPTGYRSVRGVLTWNTTLLGLNNMSRIGYTPLTRKNNLGFRCAIDGK